MDNIIRSVAEIDVLQTGLLRRMDIPESPRVYTLRDYGLLECPETSFSLSLTNATIIQNSTDQTLLITDSNDYSIMLQAESASTFTAWASSLAAVTAASEFRVARKIIGCGKNATVFRGVRERDGIPVAVKAVSRNRRPTAALVESHISRFLVRAAVEGYPVGLVRCLATYHTKNETHSVMEATFGPSLESWIVRHGRLSEGIAKSVVAQLLPALEFLHSREVVHCGVCAENVLIANDKGDVLDVRLGGFSRAYVKGESGWVPKRDHEELTLGMKGVYTAPELLEGKVSPSVDFWGLGVLLYRALVGRLPFWRDGDTVELAEDRLRAYSKLTRSDVRRGILFPEGDEATVGLSADARSFLATLLIPRVEERMSARSMDRHPWLLLARMPVKRRSGSDSPVDVFMRSVAR